MRKRVSGRALVYAASAGRSAPFNKASTCLRASKTLLPWNLPAALPPEPPHLVQKLHARHVPQRRRTPLRHAQLLMRLRRCREHPPLRVGVGAGRQRLQRGHRAVKVLRAD